MGNTARQNLPYPENTDPLANAAAATQALAAALDDLLAGKARRAATAVTTNASGQATISHGLGATPIIVLANSGSSSFYFIAVSAFTATTFTVTVRNLSSAGAPVVASTALSVSWLAIA